MLFNFADVSTIKRSVTVEVIPKKRQTLTIEWERVGTERASQLLADMNRVSSMYVVAEGEADAGEPLSIMEAASGYAKLSNASGGFIDVPVLHDWVAERNRDEILSAQREFMKDLFLGNDDDDGLFIAWDLKQSHDDGPIEMTNENWDMVFDYAEFFWPVWSDCQSMLVELTNGKDKEKNSKNSGGSTPGRKKTALRA